MSIHRTIKREREARKWSMEDLAARISAAEGLSKPLAWQTVQQWEREGGTAPKRKRMEVVASLFGLTVAELLGDSSSASTSALANTEPGPDIRGLVPLISWVRAGTWCEASDPLQPGDAEEWLPCPTSHSPGTFALRVRGDSMTAPHGRSYPEGCVIYVDPERKSPVNGERVVACLAGHSEVTFKVFKDEDARRWLQPLNPSHEPIREAFHVLGTVIGKWEPE